MLQTGYKPSQGDHNLFIKHTKGGSVTILLVCLDNIFVTRNYEIEKEGSRNCLAREFDLELGKLKYFLAIKVAYSKQ